MAPDTPEPEAPPPGSPRSAGDAPRPPRVLVEVGDLEDPAEWDVILVENQDIDDDTARRIAAQRAGRPLPPSRPRLGPRLPAGPSVSLPSLDERDVMQAFETDRDAEDAAEIDVDAFARPDDGTPVRRRGVAELPPVDDAFADHPEPGDEPEPEPEPEPVADEPEPEPVADEPEAEPRAEEPAEPWTPATREGPELLDDPDDEFYAIGSADASDELDAEPDADAADAPADASADDATHADPSVEVEAETSVEADAIDTDDTDDATDDTTDTDTATDNTDTSDTDAADLSEDASDEPAEDEDEAEATDAPAEAGGWDLTAVALDEERELLDDPDDDFYSLGRNRIAAFLPRADAAVPPLPAPTARLSSDLWGTGGDETAAIPDDEVFEEELEVDSTFPLGPDDLAIDGELEPVALDELDYANVFGPVEGDLVVPDLDGPPASTRRHRSRAAYQTGDDLYVFEDDDRHRPVPEPRKGGRRRELLALGLAAGVIVALGVGSQVLARPDRQEATTESTTTSTSRPRARTTDTTTAPPDLTLPTLPADGATIVPGEITVTTRGRGTTTTTVKKGSSTTVAPVTTVPPPTTAPPVTTTTEPPPTTTTEPPSTTTTVGS